MGCLPLGIWMAAMKLEAEIRNFSRDGSGGLGRLT
jgi:hypothetical protein